MIFTALFRAWVALAAGLIAGGWIASVAGDLELMKYVGPAWLVAVIAWVTLQLRRNGCEEWHDLRRFILFWPHFGRGHFVSTHDVRLTGLPLAANFYLVAGE